MTYGPFSPSGQIRITLGDGNDQLNVASSMTVSMFVDGGAGDDTIKGGGGNDILLGGPGNDRLMGAAGRDLLIGGTGADRILGDQDDDIMISGTTAHDTNAAALQAIASEWTSTRSYLVRIANIQDGSGSPTMRNNGSFFFAVGSTLSDDGAADSLTGNAGSDWFILSATDVLTNVQSSEFGPTIV
jgi:Ca2+-binding RTX toxin-like protein